MADIQPELTWQQIFDLPTENPEVAAALEEFLEEMAELARSLPPDEPTEAPADDQ